MGRRVVRFDQDDFEDVAWNDPDVILGFVVAIAALALILLFGGFGRG